MESDFIQKVDAECPVCGYPSFDEVCPTCGYSDQNDNGPVAGK